MKREFRFTRRIGVNKPPKNTHRDSDYAAGIVVGVLLFWFVLGILLFLTILS